MDLIFRIIKEKAIKNFAITIINEVANEFRISKKLFIVAYLFTFVRTKLS